MTAVPLPAAEFLTLWYHERAFHQLVLVGHQPWATVVGGAGKQSKG